MTDKQDELKLNVAIEIAIEALEQLTSSTNDQQEQLEAICALEVLRNLDSDLRKREEEAWNAARETVNSNETFSDMNVVYNKYETFSDYEEEKRRGKEG